MFLIGTNRTDRIAIFDKIVTENNTKKNSSFNSVELIQDNLTIHFLKSRLSAHKKRFLNSSRQYERQCAKEYSKNNFLRFYEGYADKYSAKRFKIAENNLTHKPNYYCHLHLFSLF